MFIFFSHKLIIEKRVAKPTVEKAKPWYHDQVVAANLPTSEISHEAMQAGLDYDPKRTYPSPSKRRNRKPTIDPGKGFPISEKAANILISKGAVDRRPKVSMASFSSTETMTTVAPSSIAPVPGGLSATTFPYLPTPHPTANFVFSRAVFSPHLRFSSALTQFRPFQRIPQIETAAVSVQMILKMATSAIERLAARHLTLSREKPLSRRLIMVIRGRLTALRYLTSVVDRVLMAQLTALKLTP